VFIDRTAILAPIGVDAIADLAGVGDVSGAVVARASHVEAAVAAVLGLVDRNLKARWMRALGHSNSIFCRAIKVGG